MSNYQYHPQSQPIYHQPDQQQQMQYQHGVILDPNMQPQLMHTQPPGAAHWPKPQFYQPPQYPQPPTSQQWHQQPQPQHYQSYQPQLQQQQFTNPYQVQPPQPQPQLYTQPVGMMQHQQLEPQQPSQQLHQTQSSRGHNQTQLQLTKCTFILKTQQEIDVNQEAIFLVGNVPQLGQWNLQNAIKLHPADRHAATQWQIIIELNTDALIEYKYVIKGQTTVARWETLPSNRLLNTSRKKEVRLTEVWGDVEGSEDWVPTKQSSPEQSIATSVPSPFSNQRQFETRRSSNSSFQSHQQMYHFPLQQNRLETPSDASFIHEEMQQQYPVRQSSLRRSDPAAETATPQMQSSIEQPFAIANESNLHKVESKESAGFPNTPQPQEPTAVPYVRMKKALQQAFKNYETTVKRELKVSASEEQQQETPKVTPQEPATPIELDYNEPILHVSYMLPYRLERSTQRPSEFVTVECYHSPTFLQGTLDYLGQQRKFNFYWVGIISTENKLTEAEEAQASKVLLEKKCFPLFMTLKDIQAFLIYYESLVKPKMHNFLNIQEDSTYIHNNWSAYVTINQKIAQKVIDVRSQIKDLKMIWVHGDHLMLTPQYVRKQFQQANLGFYFHSAFPASAVFSSLYYRRELLTALLQSDLVGFHLFEYARNFLNVCERLFNLNLDYSNGGQMSVNYHGRIVGVRVSHIGIDEEFIQHLMNSKDFKKQVAAFKAEFKTITEAARKSTLQSQGSRSSANLGVYQSRLAHRAENIHTTETTNISTSQSSNSLRTFVDPTQQQQQGTKPIVITSIDTFTPLSGFITKLKGYQRFLQTYPSYRNKIVLIQFIPSIYCSSDSVNSQNTDKYMTDSISTLNQLRVEITQITREIQKEFGTHCLMLQEGNPPLAKRLAVWSQSQILMIATLKDGLCLPPLEFVTVKKILSDFQNSSMIISEYAGCSNAFTGFHDFNSFNLLDICKALDAALSTPNDKKAEMMSKAYKYCSNRSFKKWVESFLFHMKQMYNPTSTVAARYIYLGLRTETSFLNKQKVIATPLDIEQCAAKFGKCHRCLILIDHEALPRKQFGRGEMHPTDQTIMDLAEITQDSRNTVALISCESRNYMQKVFNRVQNIWLAAESGYEYRINGQWQTMFKMGSRSWLKILKKLMQEYCDNVDGSCVEERNSTIVWNYKNAEEEHGHLCAKELSSQINHLIGPNAPIEIVQGNGFLEVKPVQLKKSTLLSIFLRELSDQVYSKVDFLLYIGADSSDEPVFEYLKNQTKQSSKSQYFSSDCQTNLCILGKKPSKADFYVDEIEKLAVLINKLGVETKKRKKNRSYNNLNDLTSNNFVQKTGGLATGGQSTNDLSKICGSLIDQSPVKNLSSANNHHKSFKQSLKEQDPILEQDANEEESVMDFANTIRSPNSDDGSMSEELKTSLSRSNNFTFANNDHRERLYSIQEADLVSQTHSLKDFCDEPQRKLSQRNLRAGVSDEARQAHNLSLTQLNNAVKTTDVLGFNAQQTKLQQAVSEQIRVVLKEEHEYQPQAKKENE